MRFFTKLVYNFYRAVIFYTTSFYKNIIITKYNNYYLYDNNMIISFLVFKLDINFYTIILMHIENIVKLY